MTIKTLLPQSPGKRTFIALGVTIVACLGCMFCAIAAGPLLQSPTPTQIAAVTPTMTPAASETPGPSDSPGPSDTPNPTATPSSSPTPFIITATFTWTPTPTNTLKPTGTATSTPTPTKPGILIPNAHPNGIALDPVRGNIFVGGRDSNTVYVISEKTLQIIASIPVGKQPFGLLYYNDSVYVANFGSASVSVISAASLSLITTINLKRYGGEPTFLAVDPQRGDQGRIFVPLHGSGQLGSIEVSGFVPGLWGNLTRYPTPAPGGGTYGTAVTVPNLNLVFVTRRDRFDLIGMDTVEAGVTNYAALEGSPYFAATNPALLRVYLTLAEPGHPDQPDRLTYFGFTGGTQLLARINVFARSNITVNVGSLGSSGGYVAIFPRVGSPWDDSVWVSADKHVLVYNADLSQSLRVFDAGDGVGNDPYAIAFNPNLSRAYVTDGDGNRVAVLSLR
jgi:YVTN family beta-propeller protein